MDIRSRFRHKSQTQVSVLERLILKKKIGTTVKQLESFYRAIQLAAFLGRNQEILREYPLNFDKDISFTVVAKPTPDWSNSVKLVTKLSHKGLVFCEVAATVKFENDKMEGFQVLSFTAEGVIVAPPEKLSKVVTSVRGYDPTDVKLDLNTPCAPPPPCAKVQGMVEVKKEVKKAAFAEQNNSLIEENNMTVQTLTFTLVDTNVNIKSAASKIVFQKIGHITEHSEADTRQDIIATGAVLAALKEHNIKREKTIDLSFRGGASDVYLEPIELLSDSQLEWQVVRVA